VTSETKFFAIVFEGNSNPRRQAVFNGVQRRRSIVARQRLDFLHLRTAQPVQQSCTS
jgi:hypothetical protein